LQLIAARAALPDFDEVVDQETAIPADAEFMIHKIGLPNATAVAYYLGKHRAECERLVSMSPKQCQQRIVEISAALAANPASIALDTADFQTYRSVRNKEIHDRYR
jgi:hypothetical protein